MKLGMQGNSRELFGSQFTTTGLDRKKKYEIIIRIRINSNSTLMFFLRKIS